MLSTYLADECAEGCVLGLYDQQSLLQLHLSRLGVVPKHTPEQWKLIADLSFPSINDGIGKTLDFLSYVSVVQVLNLLAHMGPDTLLAKVDIRNAYHMLPVHPDDR